MYSLLPTVLLIAGMIAVVIYRLFVMTPPASAPADWRRRNVHDSLLFVSLTLSVCVAIRLYLHM